ncbi:hypothetical protein ABT023_26120 [Micromonospora sp. NPDC002296]|uniref:hypothetical protein n=1 Tax=Micromonospora sp. NPDC002296 TaxID=3154271 RepID=UPI00332C478E
MDFELFQALGCPTCDGSGRTSTGTKCPTCGETGIPTCPVHTVVIVGCPHPNPADIYRAAGSSRGAADPKEQ